MFLPYHLGESQHLLSGQIRPPCRPPSCEVSARAHVSLRPSASWGPGRRESWSYYPARCPTTWPHDSSRNVDDVSLHADSTIPKKFPQSDLCEMPVYYSCQAFNSWNTYSSIRKWNEKWIINIQQETSSHQIDASEIAMTLFSNRKCSRLLKIRWKLFHSTSKIK